MSLTLRQRIEATYFRTRRLLLGRCDLEAYYLAPHLDMNKRVVMLPVLAGLDLPVDWRAMQRARRDSIVIYGALLIVWSVFMNAMTIARLGVSATWWLPGSFAIALWTRGDLFTRIPWAQLLVWFMGCVTIDAVKRVITVYRACDRTELGTEHGSSRFAMPEELASFDRKDNLFPGSYDIFGGFDNDELARQHSDFDILAEHKARMEKRLFAKQAPELPLGSQAMLAASASAQAQAPKSRIQAILED